MIVEEREPNTCEFAIAVADSWRGTGLARTLLERLLGHAAASGIQRVLGDTISSNSAMIALARRAGFTVARNSGDAELVRLARDLAPR